MKWNNFTVTFIDCRGLWLYRKILQFIFISIYMHVNMFCRRHLTQFRVIYITRCQQRNEVVYQLFGTNKWRMLLIRNICVQMYYCKEQCIALMLPNAYRNCENKLKDDYKILNKCAGSWDKACYILHKSVLRSRAFILLAGE